MSSCPCCGSDLSKADRPLISLDTNKLMAGAEIVKLTRREAEIMSVLIEAMPAPINNERMIARIWGGDPVEDAYDCIKVHICKLRKKIGIAGLAIRTVWGAGHALEYAKREAA